MRKSHWLPLLAVTIGAAACAGRAPAPTSVAVLPVAEGMAATTVRYDLHVNQDSAGTVTVSAGSADREAHDTQVVRLTVGIENRTRDRRFVLPLSEVMLRDAEGGKAWPEARLVEVDRQPVPEAIAVEPGRTRGATLAFTLPPGVRVADLDRATFAWTLVIEDPNASERPVRFARATALITDENRQPVAPFQPPGMLPAASQRSVPSGLGPQLSSGARGNQAMRHTKEGPAAW